MSNGLYWAYVKAWQEEKPVSKYNLSPGAALMLRQIIDALNVKFWPSFGIRIDNKYFKDYCNFNNREMVRCCRNELISKQLISWHRDNSNKTKSGYYQLIWKPEKVRQQLNEYINESLRQEYLTPAPLNLRTIKG